MRKENITLLLLALASQSYAQTSAVNVRYLDGSNHLTPQAEIERIELGEADVTVVTSTGERNTHAIADIDRIDLNASTSKVGRTTGNPTVEIKVYADRIVVGGVENRQRILLFNAKGQTVGEAVASHQSAVIPTSNLPKGAYVVSLGNTAQTIIKH